MARSLSVCRAHGALARAKALGEVFRFANSALSKCFDVALLAVMPDVASVPHCRCTNVVAVVGIAAPVAANEMRVRALSAQVPVVLLRVVLVLVLFAVGAHTERRSSLSMEPCSLRGRSAVGGWFSWAAARS